MNLTALLSRWNALSLRGRMMAAGGVVAAGLLLLLLFAGGGRSCGTRADVEARVAAVSAALQESAAQGRINTQELAARIKRLNGAATDFETSKDLSAYCEALDNLDEDFRGAQ